MILSAIVSRWRKRYARSTTWNLRNNFDRMLRWASSIAPAAGELRAFLPRVPGPRARTVVATVEEANRMIDHAPPWLRVFILSITELAMRFNTAYRLAPQHVDTNKHVVSITTKGGELLVLPTTPRLEALFATAPEGDPSTPYWQLLLGKPLSQRVIRNRFHELVDLVGGNPKLIPHDMRRTTAKLLYDQTHDIRVVSQALGHQSLKSTLHYLQPHNPLDIKPLLDALWKPGRVQ